jgi:hypothetical protein
MPYEKPDGTDHMQHTHSAIGMLEKVFIFIIQGIAAGRFSAFTPYNVSRYVFYPSKKYFFHSA